MAFFREYDRKDLAIGIIVSVITSTISIILASSYIARKASEQTIAKTMSRQLQPRIIQTENIGNVGNINLKEPSSTEPKPAVSIITNEFYNNEWNPILVHRFYANSEEELENSIQVHKMSDSFFAASFDGVFNWKGTEIKLNNTIQYS